MAKEEERIRQILHQLVNLGPMLPGSLSKQWNVCGTPGCQCKDRKKPIRHGPYFQLSFSVKGRSSTLFIKSSDVPEVKRRIRRYRQFRELVMALAQAYVDMVRTQGLTRS